MPFLRQLQMRNRGFSNLNRGLFCWYNLKEFEIRVLCSLVVEYKSLKERGNYKRSGDFKSFCSVRLRGISITLGIALVPICRRPDGMMAVGEQSRVGGSLVLRGMIK